ncbi:MAG: hypothetical protein ABI466_03015 [Chloroflexota bacterium]
MSTGVNAPQRPSDRRGLAAVAIVAVVASLALVAILAPRGGQQTSAPTVTASATPTASSTATATTLPSATASSAATATVTAPATTTYQSPLGYSVQLPAGWRRSDLQSRTTPWPAGQGDPDLIGTELYTRLTPGDETEAIRRTDTGVGPALQYTASVSLLRNSRTLSAMAYADREKGGFGLPVVSVEPTTVDGRPGAKTTFKFTTSDPTTFYSLYVPDGERMWIIRYFTAPPGTAIPAGATETAVRGIVESFRFAR